MRLTSGTRLGPYEIVAPIGSGGMGEVYRATDTRLGRDVAVKVLPASMAQDDGARARFEREARAIASLNHPNICTLHDVGSADGHTYLVMELLAGETLYQLLSRGPLPIAAILDHGASLADALDAAHTRALVHRDLKPANIFVTTPGVMKILDFGLAKGAVSGEDATRQIEAALTGAGTAIGTMSYMSPEQLKGDPLDARSDLFSLGLVLYEMTTGRRAFDGKTSAQVSAAILHESPTPPSTWRAEVPARLEDVILKALEKDRELRYQSAADLRGDLKRLKRQSDAASSIGSTVTPATTVTRVAPAAVPPAPSSSDAALAASLVRRHPMALAVVALAVVAGVVGAWFAFGRPAQAVASPDLTFQTLTNDGQAGQATIAPDGKFIAYVRSDGVRSSVVVRQLASNSDHVILPPSGEFDYYAPSVTTEDSYVDVVAFHRKTKASSLIRVPFLGGPARTIVERAHSGIGWSPDGRRMAFIRYESSTLTTSLVVADAEGQNEKILHTRTSPQFLAGIMFDSGPPARPAWSPDGRWIAVAATGTQEDGRETFTIVEVQAVTGEPGPVRTTAGFVTELAYRSNDEIIASIAPSGNARTEWWLYRRSGDPVQLTRDLNNISDVQLTADRTAGVATRTTSRSAVVIGPIAGGGSASFVEAVPESSAVPFGSTLDGAGNLYYMARVPGSWMAYRSEGGRSAGVSLGSRILNLVPSVDGRFVIGTSGDQVVKLNTDGGSPVVLLADASASPLAILKDGSALVYASNRDGHQQPWLLPLTDGEPRRLADTYIAGSQFWLTLDGDRVIFYRKPSAQLCRFPAFSDCRALNVVAGPLSADGRTVYAVDPTDPRNLIAQPIDGGKPVPITHFTDRVIGDFSLSPDRTKVVITRFRNESDVVMIKGIR